MAETVSGLIAALVDEASFDVEPGTALVWINRQWRTMLGRARAYKKTISFGVTTNGTAYYPASVLELYSLTVDGAPYSRARREDGYWNSQGQLVWTRMDQTGLFYPDASSAAVRGFSLIPTPTEDGLAIVGFAAVEPPDLTDDSDGNTLLAFLDGEFIEPLIAGAMAIGYQREGNDPLATSNSARFDGAVDELRRVEKRRMRGPGPTQLRTRA